MKEKVIINIKKSYILSIILFFVAAIIGAMIQISVRDNFYISFNWIGIIFLIIVIPVHEGLHALGFIFLSKAPKENVEFGIHKEYLVPYCHCSNYENAKSGFLKVLLLPNVVLSIISVAILLFVDNVFWSLVLGCVVSSGTGDFHMAYIVSTYGHNAKFIDHPTEPGFYVIH